MRIRISDCLTGTLALVVLQTAALAAEPACGDAKAHEFDFWIGDWDVTNVEGGKPVGHNRIAPILDGCVLQETWRGISGSAGSSLNFYDTERQRWRQLWVWREGTTLELEGEYRDGRMVLSGTSKEPDGAEVLNRITWYDNADDTVRQQWEVSRDRGTRWETIFNGLYRRRL
jgi:hypothetical protein